MSRNIQKFFGFVAIATGLGIVAAALSGVRLPVIILPIISLVVLGWVIYYFVVIRPAPTGVERPEHSPPHEPDEM